MYFFGENRLDQRFFPEISLFALRLDILLLLTLIKKKKDIKYGAVSAIESEHV